MWPLCHNLSVMLLKNVRGCLSGNLSGCARVLLWTQVSQWPVMLSWPIQGIPSLHFMTAGMDSSLPASMTEELGPEDDWISSHSCLLISLQIIQYKQKTEVHVQSHLQHFCSGWQVRVTYPYSHLKRRTLLWQSSSTMIAVMNLEFTAFAIRLYLHVQRP